MERADVGDARARPVAAYGLRLLVVRRDPQYREDARRQRSSGRRRHSRLHRADGSRSKAVPVAGQAQGEARARRAGRRDGLTAAAAARRAAICSTSCAGRSGDARADVDLRRWRRADDSLLRHQTAQQTVADMGRFLTTKAWYTDETDPFKRAPSVMTYDRANNRIVDAGHARVGRGPCRTKAASARGWPRS